MLVAIALARSTFASIVERKNGCAAIVPRNSLPLRVNRPQAFSFSLVKNAYEQMLEHEDTTITDDAMVVEKIAHHKVQMIEGSYSNIKITTPEDMKIAEILLSEK